MRHIACCQLALSVALAGLACGRSELSLGPICGNGWVELPEECDDGNDTTGDGCGSDCLLETAWHCRGEPSLCARADMVIVEPGSFVMGSPLTESGRAADETAHQVTLTHAFAIQQTEVTQEQFQTLLGHNPSAFGPDRNSYGIVCGSDCPVEYVTWIDAAVYANELSIRDGYEPCYELTEVVCAGTGGSGQGYLRCYEADEASDGILTGTVTLNGVESVYDCEGYRLPTEAEWEFAARGGTSSATYAGELGSQLSYGGPNDTLDAIAWFSGNSTMRSWPVAEKLPNPLGLYDVLGNVWERTNDIYGDYAGDETDPEGPATGLEWVARGGSWEQAPGDERAAARRPHPQNHRSSDDGFRVVRTLQP